MTPRGIGIEVRGSIVSLFLAVSTALLLLVLLVPVIAVAGAVLGFMVATHRA